MYVLQVATLFFSHVLVLILSFIVKMEVQVGRLKRLMHYFDS